MRKSETKEESTKIISIIILIPSLQRSEVNMFWSKNNIIEKVSKIPNTLEAISEDIFSGMNPDKEYLHRVSLQEVGSPLYFCMRLNKNLSLEPELMYPSIDSSLSNEYAIHPSPYRFILPYDLKGVDTGKEPRLFEPEELKLKFPMIYFGFVEFKKYFNHDQIPLSSADYDLSGCKLLQYVNTPKIVVSDHYSLQASFDTVGNHIFEKGCGIILKDPSRYLYVLAVLNSSISRVFSEICKSEGLCNGSLTPGALRRFPIVFPTDRVLESLIDTLSSYLIYIHSQMYGITLNENSGDYELLKFYERIVNLLVLDVYFTNDLDPMFLKILGENIQPINDECMCENNRDLMDKMQIIKQKILDVPDFGKCRFNSEFTNILATLKNNGVW